MVCLGGAGFGQVWIRGHILVWTLGEGLHHRRRSSCCGGTAEVHAWSFADTVQWSLGFDLCEYNQNNLLLFCILTERKCTNMQKESTFKEVTLI